MFTEEILHEAYKSGDTVQTPPEMPPYLVPGARPQGRRIIRKSFATSCRRWPDTFFNLAVTDFRTRPAIL